MNIRKLCKINDSALQEGDIYNDGTYSGKVKEVNSDNIVVETQNEEGEVVDVTIPKVSDGVVAIDEPSDQDIIESATDPEFICDLIEVVSGGENKITKYRENEDGTLDIFIERPITRYEAKLLHTAGVRVGIEAMNKEGWVTIFLNPITDSELSPGDDYNDGTYSGKVKEVNSDNIRISSQDENGNEVEIEIPIGDSAVSFVKESNIDDILDNGETIVIYNPEETNPYDILSQIELELSEFAAPGEVVPELDLDILSDNRIKVFVF